MHVLITNHALRTRGGSELYTRDLAIGLQARGVAVSVYSPLTGEVAAEIAGHGIPVCSELDQVRGTPDLIHGHHHVQTIAALCRFPATPAIFVCHGVDPWQEMPPIHPAILRYYAVGPLTADHVRTTACVPGDRITIMPNWVDTDRFVQKASLAQTPQEALVVSNAPYDTSAIEAACQSRGIRLRRFGLGFGQSSAQLEDEFRRVDLVFAVGRTALEAMAAGCGVILAGGAGLAELLLPENFDSYRGKLGTATLRAARMNPGSISAEIAKYDPAGVRDVSNLVRQSYALRDAMDRWMAEHDAIVRGGMASGDPAERLGRYLSQVDGQLRSFDARLRQLARRCAELEQDKRQGGA